MNSFIDVIPYLYYVKSHVSGIYTLEFLASAVGTTKGNYETIYYPCSNKTARCVVHKEGNAMYVSAEIESLKSNVAKLISINVKFV